MEDFKGRVKPLHSPYPPPFSRAFLAPRYWGTWLGLGLLWLLTQLPGRWRRALGRRLGALMYRQNAKRRRFALLNLRWCFPELPEAERERIAQDYFRYTGQSMLDYGLLWWGSERQLARSVRLEGEENLRPHLAAGTPVILLTGHHVALDVAGAAYSQRYPGVSIFKEVRNPLLGWFIARGRNRFGGVIYERSDNMRPLVKAIRGGYPLYYLPDEDLGPQRSVFAPFFGVSTATLPALGRLAQLCRAVVVPYMAYYEPDGDRYVARFFPALEGFPTGDEVQDATRMNEALEMMIRRDPAQYMWSMRMFQTRPDGEPNPYG